MKRNPPKIAEWFLSRLTNPEYDHSMIGDVQEEYVDICKETGSMKALT